MNITILETQCSRDYIQSVSVILSGIPNYSSFKKLMLALFMNKLWLVCILGNPLSPWKIMFGSCQLFCLGKDGYMFCLVM